MASSRMTPCSLTRARSLGVLAHQLKIKILAPQFALPMTKYEGLASSGALLKTLPKLSLFMSEVINDASCQIIRPGGLHPDMRSS